MQFRIARLLDFVFAFVFCFRKCVLATSVYQISFSHCVLFSQMCFRNERLLSFVFATGVCRFSFLHFTVLDQIQNPNKNIVLLSAYI
jgi:hypothetical protein